MTDMCRNLQGIWHEKAGFDCVLLQTCCISFSTTVRLKWKFPVLSFCNHIFQYYPIYCVLICCSLRSKQRTEMSYYERNEGKIGLYNIRFYTRSKFKRRERTLSSPTIIFPVFLVYIGNKKQ